MTTPPWINKKSMDAVTRDIIDWATGRIPFDGNPFEKTIQLGGDKKIPIWSTTWKNRYHLFIKRDEEEMGREGTILHEYKIGSQMNQFRDIIPNFSYTYGMGSCSNLQMRQFYTPQSQKKSLLISEYTPGITCKDFLVNKPFFTNLNLFVQVMMAIDIAHQKIGFVHGDLFIDNTSIRFLKEPVLVPYGDILFETTQIPIIYDYDRSYIPGTGEEKNHFDDVFIALNSFMYHIPKYHRETIFKWYGLQDHLILSRKDPTRMTHAGLRGAVHGTKHRSIDELINFLEIEFKFRLSSGKTDIILAPVDF